MRRRKESSEPLWAYELGARLALAETLLSDLILNALLNSPDPTGNFATVRDETIRKLKFDSSLPPDTTHEGAEIAFEVQARAIEFAGRFFDVLEANLAKAQEG